MSPIKSTRFQEVNEFVGILLEENPALTRKELMQQVANLGISQSYAEKAYYAQRPQGKPAANSLRLAKMKEISRSVKLPAQPITQASKIKDTIAARKTKEKMQITLPIPKGGLVLKLTNGNGMVGTFHFSNEGFCFIEANGKVTSERRVLGWNVAKALFKNGIF
jgi:hypothetical protein